ncbi:hypothetical protein KEM56_000718 [Ascosphaera pollenicola]|nr:hypothetical protein KEM56_000718 [Ascosphaera pollenicola]
MSQSYSILSVSKDSLVTFKHAVAGQVCIDISDGLLCDPSGWFITKPCTPKEIQFYESSVHHPGLMQFMPQMLGQLQLQEQSQPQPQSQPPAQSTDGQSFEPAVVTPTSTPIITQAPPLPSASASSDYSEIKRLARTSTGETDNAADTLDLRDWMPAHGTKIPTNLAIVIENIACGFKKPSIIDIKLGSRLWAEDAPPAKRRRLDEVSRGTTSGSLGFRIAGMKVWVGEKGAKVRSYEREKDVEEQIESQRGETSNSGAQPKVTVIEVDGYHRYDRWYGRSLTSDNVDEGFRTFLSGTNSSAHDHTKFLAKRIALNLRNIQSALEKEETRMYSSSVLIIYEGDPEALDEAIAGEEENERLRREKHSLFDGESDGEDGIASGELPSELFHVVGHSTATSLSTVNADVPPTVDLNDVATAVQSTDIMNYVANGAASVDGMPTMTTTTMNIEDLAMNGEEDAEEDDDEPPKILETRLIDFAHANYTPGQGPDVNVLHGLRSAASIFEKIAQEGGGEGVDIEPTAYTASST